MDASDPTVDPISESKYATMAPAEVLADYAKVRGDIAEDYALDQVARIWQHQVAAAEQRVRNEIALSIHVDRFHENRPAPDSWYAGMLHAEHIARGDA